MKNTPKPADGERRAMIGYVPQYRVAADLIYSALVDGTFEWVRIADLEAGQVDDIQIAKQGRLDAFQVKWGKTTQNVPFRFLTTEEKGKKDRTKPSLMRQLAEGWQRLVRLHPDRQVYVHLISRHVPSPTTSIPLDDPPPPDSHFQGFLRDCWQDKSWVTKGLAAIPTGWRSAMAELQTAADLSDEEFIRFVGVCSLCFQYQLPSHDGVGGREEVRRVSDTEQIFRVLFEVAGNEKRIIQLTRTELLQRLGWEDRFRFRFRHEFWVDEKLYQPIAATVTELEVILERCTQGYLALIGTPGSGKSTTLTQTLRYRKGFRVVRYYAFVRDDTRLGRGESLNFLHDLVLALKQQGIYGQGKSYPESREELLEQLGSQLAELCERWRKEGIRTLILIDGLDHIEREQSPERTLLRDLPPPENVPDGVLFVLGSQKLDLVGLSSRTQAHLQEEGRTLTMRSLDRQAVFAIAEAASLPTSLSHPHKEKILQLSDGHPLALSYLLQKLQAVSNNEQIDAILDAANPYHGHIERDYEVYWQSLEADREIRNLLALISRLRGALDLTETITWVGEPVVERFIKQAHHYFRVETDTRWHFFHNSFRQFLLAKTGRNLFGVMDEQRHRAYHRQLADYTARAKPGTVWSWEELYHWASAGDSKAVIRLASQENFRNQFYVLRPLEDIQDDITLCLKAARDVRDGLAIIRCFLIEAELQERNHQLGEVDFPRLLLELNGVDAVVRYVLRGRELRIDETAALEFCDLLIAQGTFEAARVIFDAAEPLDLLSGSKGVETILHGTIDQVKAWAAVAHYFRPLEQIFQAIDQLQADTSRSMIGQSPEEATQYVRRSARVALADGIFESDDTKQFLALRNILEKRADLADIILRLDFQTCAPRKSTDEAITALDRILSWAERSNVSDIDRVLIAEFLLHIKNDKAAAAQWLESVPQPLLYDFGQFGYDWKHLSPFSQRIRLNRLQSALGIPVEPVIAVPDDAEERRRGNVFFERMIVLLANLWGRAWRGEIMSPSEILHDVHPALVLFNRRWRETGDWHPWDIFRQAAPDYFALLIRSVAAHGPEALIALSETFNLQWQDQATQRYWQTRWKRHIALELYRAGNSPQALKEHLSGIESEMGVWDDVEERVRDCIDHALAWSEAGELQRAHALLPRMLKTTFGVYYRKDDQFSLWVQWLTKINAEQKEGIEERIRRFAGALVVLEQANRGEGTQGAAQELVETVAAWSPGYALELRTWLLEQRAIYYTRALEGLLAASLKDLAPPIEIIFSITRHLLIPFQANDPQYLAKLLAARCHRTRTTEEARKLLQLLVRTIETKALPSERWAYWSGLVEGLKQARIDASWIEEKLAESSKRAEETTHPAVTLTSGETLTKEDAIRRVNSYEDMLTFVDSISKVEYLHWERIVSKIVDSLTADQIKTLQEHLGRFEPRPMVSTLFAQRLASLGHVDEARNITEQALQQSTPRGWDERYDGGSRLVAVETLLSVNAKYSRDKVYNLLVDDYLSESRYPAQFLQNLDRIVPMLFEQPPLTNIWTEIEQHVYQLADFSEAKSFLPSPSNISNEESHARALLRILFTDPAMPAAEIRNEAHQALCELIRDRTVDSLISEQIESLLTDGEENQVRVLALLEATASYRPDFVEAFSQRIQLLCASPAMTARQMAQNLAEALRLQPTLVDDSRRVLPLTYRLELPELPLPQVTMPLEAIPEGQPYPDSDDPLEMIRPFQPHFERVADLTDIPLQNLVARAVTLMNTLKPRGEWDKRAEENLLGWLRAADLELSFYRLRPSLAFRAFGHVLAELADAQILSGEKLVFLQQLTTIHDPTLSLLEPMPRPPEIVVPKSDEMGSYPRKEWVHVGYEAFPLLLDCMEDGRIVLSELSCFAHLDWEKPSEYRLMMICHPDWPAPEKLYAAGNFFPHDSLWLWGGWNYPRLRGVSQWPSTVVYAHPFQVEFGGTEWLAINPDIPLRLGWKRTTDGLFRWVDSTGTVMVESLRWQDGSIHRHPPRLGEVCSEGWLVVASSEAAQLIARTVGKAIRLGTVLRQYRDRDKKDLVRDFASNQKAAW